MALSPPVTGTTIRTGSYNPRTIPKGAEWQNIPIDNRPPAEGGPGTRRSARTAARASHRRSSSRRPNPKRRRPVAAHLGGISVGGGALPDGSMPYLVEPPEPDEGGPDLPVVGDGATRCTGS